MKNNKFLSKAILYVIILLLLISLTACGNRNGTDEVRGDEIIPVGKRTPVEFTVADNYISELYALGNITYAYSAASDGSTVYIFGSEELPGGDGVKWSLYVLDIDTPADLEKLPYEMEADKIVMSISLNHDEYIDLAVVEDAGAVSEGLKTDISIRRISRDGRGEIFRIDISGDIFDDEYIFPQDLIIDSDNRIYLVISNAVYIWDMQGGLLNKITINGDMPKLSQDFLGTDIYVTYNQAGQGKIARIDTESGSLGYSHDLTGVSIIYGLAPASRNKLLTASEIDVGVYDTTSNSLNELFTWSSVDMTMGMLGMFLPFNEGRLGWLDNKTGRPQLRLIRPLSADDIAETIEKTTLLLGGNDDFATLGLRAAIVEFNMNNPHYRIEFQDYGSSDEDMFRLNMDIISGKAPDIILLPYRMSMELYASKGVLTDIHPFIDGDSSIDRADYYENILKAYEVDGQLLAIPLSIKIDTLSAPKSSVGDINSWTLDGMISYVDSLAPNLQVFDYNDKSGVLRICLRANGDALVDWSGEGSGFRRDLVFKMLNFANRFTPDEIYVYDNDLVRRIQDDRQVKLVPAFIFDYLNFGRHQAYFGEPLSYPGYPSENGNGHLIVASGALAINNNSEHKEGAWEFISAMLKDEYQKIYHSNTMGFPILKKGMEYVIDNLAAHIRFSYDGISPMTERLDDYGNTFEIRIPDESDIKFMQGLISSADKIRSFDLQISNIVFEEAQLYFTGAKSLEETLDVIENRISMYVYELK